MNKLHLFLMAFLLLGQQSLIAQSSELKRKASLGIALQPMNDSIANANNLKQTIGVYIPRVLPESTADKMGIKAGDILVKIGTNEINAPRDVFMAISDLRANDPVQFSYYRRGKLKTSEGKAEPRPIETSEYADIYYEQVTYEGNKLRSILHIPKGIETPPVVFYIQGYTCQSVELSTAPDITIRRLIDDWVQAGFAVYRVEKPGMGDSDCENGCYDLNFNEEIEGFRQGYLSLKKDTRIDTENIFLFGHSIGGMIAPVLAAEQQPKGVITYGTLVNTWFEYMQELTRIQGEMFNSPYSQIEEDIRTVTPFWYKLLIEKKTPEELLKNEKIVEMLTADGTLETFKTGQYMDRHYTYWSTIQDIEFVNEWLNVKSSVLALHGEFDIQALNANHIFAIERIVNSHSPGKAKAIIIEGADHGFVRFESMEENVNALNSGNYGTWLRNSYHDGIAKTTVKWMNSQLDK